jgi:hypothetical protein
MIRLVIGEPGVSRVLRLIWTAAVLAAGTSITWVTAAVPVTMVPRPSRAGSASAPWLRARPSW